MRSRRLVLAAALACIAGWGCSVRPEEPILARFFGASRLRDRTALGRVATTIFEPRTDGIVRRFEIARVGPLSRRRSTSADADVAARSLDDAGPGANPDRATELETEEIQVTAPVEMPDGATVNKTLDVTLQRAIAADATGHWIVTAVR